MATRKKGGKLVSLPADEKKDKRVFLKRQQERREALREKVGDSRQLEKLLVCLQKMEELYTEIKKQGASTFYREKGVKYNLLMTNLEKRMNKHLALINKVLADDKVVEIDDPSDVLPKLSLTIVDSTQDSTSNGAPST